MGGSVMSTDNQSAQSERELFKRHFAHRFDLTEKQGFGGPEFVQEAVESIWYGWNTRSALAQAPAPSGEAREGWVLVPIEPTEAMLRAEAHDVGERTARKTWEVMIAAAPKGASK